MTNHDAHTGQNSKNPHCLYCGNPTASREFVENPGATGPLYCCSAACHEKFQKFIKWDNKTRTPFYIVLFVMVVANLFMFGFNVGSFWRSLPLLGICLAVLAIPSVFTRYERYQSLGLVKTRRLIRTVAALLAVFALALLLFH